MDRETLEAMLGSMEKYLSKFREYLKAKAKYLGYEGSLPFYDLFAPLGNADIKFSYDEAHGYLVEVLGRFSDEMGSFIDHAFRNRWIDAFPKQGKGGGAFCSSIHAISQSRILSNFIGSFSDVTTLAHELGHAYHGYCLKDFPVINTNYPMPLAETASIFNELLVSQATLADASSDTALAIIEAELMAATQVIVDIYSRYLFETELFSRRADTTLTVEELKAMMLSAQIKAYGDGLDSNILHPYMWQNKTHYYLCDLHFYNFPYAFGLLFGHGVYAQYQAEPTNFPKKYKELLQATGTNSVADTAKKIGIDIRTSEFWDTSLEDISKTIDKFVSIVG
jgi:pepF/M3 family oligoendopeptidase